MARRTTGTPIVGICGGYQMLGDRIVDPEGVESQQVEVRGLALLPVTTVFEREKATHQVVARVVGSVGLLAGCTGTEIKGYEIHMGRTEGEMAPGAFQITQRSGRASHGPDGALDSEGRTLGTYLHGLFHNRDLRRGLLVRLAQWKGVSLPPERPDVDADAEYDKLAEFVRQHMDMEMIYRMVASGAGV